MNATPASNFRGGPFDPAMGDDPPTVMVPPRRAGVFAVIQIDLHGAALRVSRLSPDGQFQLLRQERDAFNVMGTPFSDPRRLAVTLADTLIRYQRIAELHGAVIRAVVLQSFRGIPNHAQLLQHLPRVTRVALELISDRETARYLCLGALGDRPADHQAVLIDVGDDTTSVILAKGQDPLALWRLGVGTSHLLQSTLMSPSDQPDGMRMRIWRRQIQHVLSQGQVDAIRGVAAEAILVRRGVTSPTPTLQLSSVTTLNEIADHLGIRNVQSTERGLPDGVLIDLSRAPFVPTGDSDALSNAAHIRTRQT